MQPTYMRSVSFWGKFTSGSRISASRSDLLKVPTIILPTLIQQFTLPLLFFHDVSKLLLTIFLNLRTDLFSGDLAAIHSGSGSCSVSPSSPAYVFAFFNKDWCPPLEELSSNRPAASIAGSLFEYPFYQLKTSANLFSLEVEQCC